MNSIDMFIKTLNAREADACRSVIEDTYKAEKLNNIKAIFEKIKKCKKEGNDESLSDEVVNLEHIINDELSALQDIFSSLLKYSESHNNDFVLSSLKSTLLLYINYLKSELYESCFNDFILSLDIRDKENFDTIVSDITSEGSEEKINSLNSELLKYKEKIDCINAERQEISQQAKRCERLLTIIDRYLKSNNNISSSPIYALKTILVSWIKDMKDEVLYAKPTKFLENKYKIRKSIQDRTNRNEFITKLLKQRG